MLFQAMVIFLPISIFFKILSEKGKGPLHFLANRNAGLAIPPLFWPVDCIKIGGHVVQLSGPTVYSLYCAFVFMKICKILRKEWRIW